MKPKSKTAAILLAFLSAGILGFGGASGVVRKGNKLFAERKYDRALAKYTEAQLSDPDNPRLHFNIGTVLYEQKKYDLAVESFKKVISGAENERLAEKAWYNLGNCYFRKAASAGDIELLAKAVDAYSQALKIDPSDKDAKYNLEVARRMLELKKQQQPPSSSCKRKQGQKNKKNGQNKKKGNQANQAKTGESKPSTAEAAVKPEENKAATPEKQPQPQQPGKMTRKEAERLLNALEERERQNARKEQIPRKGRNRPFAGKDW